MKIRIVILAASSLLLSGFTQAELDTAQKGIFQRRLLEMFSDRNCQIGANKYIGTRVLFVRKGRKNEMIFLFHSLIISSCYILISIRVQLVQPRILRSRRRKMMP